MIKPYDYQQDGIDKILEKLKVNKSALYQAPTGAGKSIVISFLTKHFVETQPEKKVLITVHKTELQKQLTKDLIRIGLSVEQIKADTKKYNHNSDVYVAMIETLNVRINKNKYFLKPVSVIISDECHFLVHDKVYNFFPDSKIIGITATPSIGGKTTYYKCECCDKEYDNLTECCGLEVMEWTKPRTMSMYYNDIVCGPKMSKLIERGQIVQDINKAINIDLSTLKEDKKGEFTNKSLNDTYGGKVVFDVVSNYEDEAKGLKTIVFNATTEVNKKVYEQFKEKGYNVRYFDSVNTPNVNREELIKWFDENDDAILCNVMAYTAGLDIREIQCVILNFATNSLARFLQAVGRGGRSSTKIYKDSFLVLDFGGNIKKFNEWSDDSRDFEKIFFEGFGKPKPKREPILNVIECENCAALTSRSDNVCEICGHEREKPKPREQKEILSDERVQIINKAPYPNAQKIIEFCERKKGDMNLAFKIFTEQVIMLFRFHQVTKELYHSTKINGKFDKKIDKMCRTFYFALLNSNLESNVHRKLDTFIEKTKKKIASLYE